MLIYDGDCGFCTNTVDRWRPRLRTPVTIVAWQEINDLGELDLTTEDVQTAAYWVDAYGRSYRGHLAAAQALLHSRAPWPLLGALGMLAPFRWIAAALYVLIARNRYRLPGSTAACRMPERVTFTSVGAPPA